MQGYQSEGRVCQKTWIPLYFLLMATNRKIGNYRQIKNKLFTI